MAVLKPYKDDYYLWKYLPSLAAACTFLALFCLATTLNVWRYYKIPKLIYLPLAAGCICEAIGYATRAACYDNTANLGLYIVQECFLVIAPAFIAASIYMTLGHIIRSIKAEHLSMIRVSRLTIFFVLGDNLSLSAQGSVAGLTAHPNTQQIASDIILAGLCVQSILLATYFAVTVVFHLRLRRQPTRESQVPGTPWKSVLYMTYTVTILVFARSIYRVVEYGQGQSGYSLGHEWTLYVFDSVPMILVSILFWYWHPGTLEPIVLDSEIVELSPINGNKPEAS